MKRGSLPECASRLSAVRTRLKQSTRASQIDGSRVIAEHIRLKRLQALNGLRAASFQNVVLAPAPRSFI
eukprot:847340-Pyramimonas_sp.AAC.1